MKRVFNNKVLITAAAGLLSACMFFLSCQSESKIQHSSFYGLTDYDRKAASGTINNADYRRNGKTVIYTAEDVSGSALNTIISELSEGDTLILDGSKGVFNLTTTRIQKSSITIEGKNSAVLDFKETYGDITPEYIQEIIEGVREQQAAGNGHFLYNYNQALDSQLAGGRGFYITGKYNIIKNLKFQNACDNGLLIGQGGDYNIVRDCEACFCGDSGFQISGQSAQSVDCSEDYKSDGPHDNKFFNCYSHNNFDPWNLGENADGFAVKGGAGDFNYFEGCIAQYNSDDGWDCYRIRGSTTWIDCQANFNGLCQATGEDWGEFSNGNGFKVGGGATKGVFNGEVVNSPAKHPHAQYLKGCSARGNRGNSGVGFDRNNQHGSIYLVSCFATDNHADMLSGTSLALRHQDYAFGSYGKPCYIKDCHIGSSEDKVSGEYEGERIMVR